MDNLKEQVLHSVFTRVKQVEGDGIYNIYPVPPTIHVMEQVENQKLQLVVSTPAGPRFFLVTVQESH